MNCIRHDNLFIDLFLETFTLIAHIQNFSDDSSVPRTIRLCVVNLHLEGDLFQIGKVTINKFDQLIHRFQAILESEARLFASITDFAFKTLTLVLFKDVLWLLMSKFEILVQLDDNDDLSSDNVKRKHIRKDLVNVLSSASVDNAARRITHLAQSLNVTLCIANSYEIDRAAFFTCLFSKLLIKRLSLTNN